MLLAMYLRLNALGLRALGYVPVRARLEDTGNAAAMEFAVGVGVLAGEAGHLRERELFDRSGCRSRRGILPLAQILVITMGNRSFRLGALGFPINEFQAGPDVRVDSPSRLFQRE